MREAAPNRKPTPWLLHLIARGVVDQTKTTPINAAGTDTVNLLSQLLVAEKEKGRCVSAAAFFRNSDLRLSNHLPKTQQIMHQRMTRCRRIATKMDASDFMV
jgi:hypothetical protein